MRLTLCVLFAVPALAGFVFSAHAEDAAKPYSTSRFLKLHAELPATPLALNVRRHAVLHGAEVQRYTFTLNAGQFAAVKIRQTGGNAAGALFDPDGQFIDLSDRTREGFDETIVVTAKKSGTYTLQTAIFEWDTAASAYEVELMRREPAATSAAGKADQLLTSWYERDHAGVAVSVVERGKVLLQRTVGLANVEDGVATTPATRFDLASVSKQFTAYAVAMLAARGAIGLDDDIRRYLPEVPKFEKTITVRHLLNHTSGLRDWDAAFGLMGKSVEDGITKDMVLDMVSRQTALNFTPGSAQQYSNTGYSLLAEIVARATKEPFGVWVQRNIFAPAGMTAIVSEDPAMGVAGYAKSYRGRYPYPHVVSGRSTATAGSSSVHASLKDLVAWAGARDRGGPGGDAVVQLVDKPDRLDDGTKIDYGFGQWFGERGGIRYVGHLGLAAGYRASVRRFPERGLSVIYLANDGDDAAYERAKIIENLFLGVAEAPLQVPDGEYTPPASNTLSDADARDYAGLYYSDELLTTYTIQANAGALTALHAINGRIRLVRAQGDTFTSDRFYMPSVVFDRDARKAVTGFRVSTEGAQNMSFRKIVK